MYRFSKLGELEFTKDIKGEYTNKFEATMKVSYTNSSNINKGEMFLFICQANGYLDIRGLNKDKEYDYYANRKADNSDNILIEELKKEYSLLLPEIKKQNLIIKAANLEKEYNEAWVHQFIKDVQKLEKEFTFQIVPTKQDYINSKFGNGERNEFVIDVTYKNSTARVELGSYHGLKSKYVVYASNMATAYNSWRSTSDLISTVIRQIKRDIPIWKAEQKKEEQNRVKYIIDELNRVNEEIMESKKSIKMLREQFPQAIKIEQPHLYAKDDWRLWANDYSYFSVRIWDNNGNKEVILVESNIDSNNLNNEKINKIMGFIKEIQR